MKKSTIIVLALFAALAVGAGVMLMKKPERGISRLDLGPIDKDAIDRVVFTGKNKGELKKDNGVWKTGAGRLADGPAVTRMVEAAAKLKSSDLITEDDAKRGELEVDEEKGTQVELYAAGKQLATFTVGKYQNGGVAVRKGDQVFKVSGVSPATFAKAEGAWVDKKIFKEKLDEVTRVEVKLSGQAPYALVKKDTAWQLEDPSVLPKDFRFDSDAARTLVSQLIGLRAKEYEDANAGAAVTGLTDTADTVTFTTGGTVTVAKAEGDKPAEEKPVPVVTRAVRLGGAKEKDVYAQVVGAADVFTVPETTAKALRKAATDLRDMKLMAFERDKVQKLSITDGKNSTSFEKKNGTWSLVKTSEQKPKDFELDSAAVDRRVGALLNARALRLADSQDKGSAGLSAASGKAVVGLEGGKSVTLSFGNETKDGEKDAVFVSGNADALVYLATKWTRQSSLGGLASFKKQPEGPGGPGGAGPGLGNIDPQALSSLPPEVREGLMKQLRQQKQQQDVIKQLERKLPPGAPQPK